MSMIRYIISASLLMTSQWLYAADKALPTYVMTTDLGPVVIELYPDHAPITVKNFQAYIDAGFYNGTIFHRVIPGFVAQGGGYTIDFIKKQTLAPIKNESVGGLNNDAWTLSMARTSAPDSATSQFYINLQNNPHLNSKNERAGYTVFGKVIEGYDVIKKLVDEPRGMTRDFPEAPISPVRILTVEALKPVTESKD